jgi:hypothetical protein
MRWQLVMIAAMIAIAPYAGAEDDSSAFDHPAVRDVLAMVEADVAENVMTARVVKLGSFPELDGRELAELKRRGVPDSVLLLMLQMTTPSRTTPYAPSGGQQAGLEPDAPVPEGLGLLRVVVKRPIRVTFLEVAVGGEAVHTEGNLWEGSVGAGQHLKRPVFVRGTEQIVAYQSPVDPGSHNVAVGFAVSTVEEDPSDEFGEYAGEHYQTRGIRATGAPLAGQAPMGNPGVECQVFEGQVCEVVATFEKTSPSRLGGLPIYSVHYLVEVTSRR